VVKHFGIAGNTRRLGRPGIQGSREGLACPSTCGLRRSIETAVSERWRRLRCG
jgi:hypothetical protein